MLLRPVAALALALGLASPVAAKTVYVGNDGLDGAACGTKSAPCRSITEAIARAAAGDTVLVGPGRYGDLDADGVFEEPGEEGGELALIEVDKRVRILSRDGAGATFLEDAAAAAWTVVALGADGASLGARGKGFTVFPGVSSTGVAVRAAGASASGNVVVGGAQGFAASANAAFAENRAIGCGLGFFAEPTGFVQIERSAALGSAIAGFDLDGEHELEGSVAVGSDLVGVNAGESSLDRCVAIGNVDVGATASGGDWDRVGAFGNAVASKTPNCGVMDFAGTLSLRRTWFGAGGPGPDPADAFCTEGGNTPESPSKKEVRVRLRPLR